MESKVSDAVLYCSWPIPPHSGNIFRMRWKTNFNSCTLQKSTTRCNRTPLNVYWLHNCITSIFSATPSMYVWKRQIKKPTHFVLGEENWSWLQLCVLKGQIQRDQIASTMNTYISVSHQHFIQTIQFHFSHNYVRLLPWHSHLHHILTRTTSTMFRRTNSNHGQ